MKEADIFILPGTTVDGRAENQGLVIQEAQAMELPVIISDAGGMNEGIINGETGFVVKEKDIKAFADKVQLLADDRNLIKSMGKAGRIFVEQHFDSAVLNRKLLSIYSS